jgi:malate synthase
MSAFIPSRRDEEINRTALARVREDKGAEAKLGFDGAWVAHPDLVPVVAAVFDEYLGDRPNQKDRRPDVPPDGRRLLDVRIPGTRVTDAGVRGNVSVALQYLEAWLRGSGAVAINNLMEDTATAEICRSQVWQWLRQGRITRDELDRAINDVSSELGPGHDEARGLFEEVATGDPFVDFLTIPAYDRLTAA